MKHLLLAGIFAVAALPIGCGQKTSPTPAPDEPSVAPVPTPPEIAAPVPAIPTWSDLHDLHELMEENGAQMKGLRKAAKEGNQAGTRKEAEALHESMEDLKTRASGFAGAEPERFRGLSDSAVTAARNLRALWEEDAAEPSGALVHERIEALRASCKGCHDVYKED